MGTLIEQPPQAQIRPNAKYLCAHLIANDKTIILSTEMSKKSILGKVPWVPLSSVILCHLIGMVCFYYTTNLLPSQPVGHGHTHRNIT